jgi:hypothetical protein
MEENDIKETKEVIEEPTSNTSIKNDDEEYDKLSIKDFIEKEKVLEEKKIKEDKIDKRKVSSRINIAKARAAKLRKAAEKKRQLQALFGSDDEETASSSESESESSEDDYRDKYHKHKYKTLFNKQRKELDDMKQLLFKLAKKQKKQSRRRRKSRSPSPKKEPQPQPVIHYNIEAPQFKKEEVKENQPNSIFTNYLKNKLTK